ncbi:MULTISPECIES: hypothetical protein [Paraliobacillus]|uniref:hypothetical protein n=1 Tax=Paraliobacillus TaxID=200903 RepID=UPI000DD302ED|nr:MULTISPECIES: hypothetical protein [Paraliobacillus]
MEVVAILGFYVLPILTIVFCLNLVSIITKVKNDEATTYNTLLLTVSFTMLMWYFALLIVMTAK